MHDHFAMSDKNLSSHLSIYNNPIDNKLSVKTIKTARASLNRCRSQNPGGISRRSRSGSPNTALPSLQRDTATLSSMPSSAAIIRSRRETRIYRFRPNSWFKGTTFHTLPQNLRFSLSLSLHPFVRATAMTIARTAMHPRLRSNVCRRVYANGYGTCLRLLCARVCTPTYIYIYMCVSLCVATIELCSNCTKLRISVSDKLRDLQYNCATSSLFPSSPIPPLSTRLCRRGRKNYSLIRDICTAYMPCV